MVFPELRPARARAVEGHPGDWEMEGPLTRPRWGSRGSLVFSCQLKEEFAGREKGLHKGLKARGQCI